MTTPTGDDDETPPTVTLWAYCRTPGCPNNGIPYQVTLYLLINGQLSECVCGVCHQQITDLQETPPATEPAEQP